MVRFADIVLTYMVIGAVMFVGGAIPFQDVGALQFFVNDTSGDDVNINETAAQNLDESTGVGTGVIGQVGGFLALVVGVIGALFGYLNWPITVLLLHDAPPQIILVVGVPLTGAFYLSVIRVFRSSS